MNAIEIRLNPAFVSTLLDAISPAMEALDEELAAPGKLPEEDELMREVWLGDLLESQREDVAIVSALFDERFMQTGSAIIEPDKMDAVLRACSAIRLKLRETALSAIEDEQLEEGSLDGIAWSESFRVAYGAYALFGTLQELIVGQLDGAFGEEDDEDDDAFGEDDDDDEPS